MMCRWLWKEELGMGILRWKGDGWRPGALRYHLESFFRLSKTGCGVLSMG